MITAKQNKVLEVLREYFVNYGQSPSLSQLQKLLNLKTKRSVVQYLESLEKKNLIQRTGNQGIKLINTSESKNFLNLPILGYANCGSPVAIAEVDYIGSIQIDKDLVKQSSDDVYVLIAKGDSMNNKFINGIAIEDKDYVVISKKSYVNDGDTVVAIIDGCATIKTYKNKGNNIVLFPESNNPIHQPIYLSRKNETYISGKVIGVLKSPFNQ